MMVLRNAISKAIHFPSCRALGLGTINFKYKISALWAHTELLCRGQTVMVSFYCHTS